MAFSYPVYSSVSTVLMVTAMGVEPPPESACPTLLAACQIVPCTDTPMGLRTPGIPPSAGIAAWAVSTSAMRNKPHRKGERFSEFVVGKVFVFIVFINEPFRSPDSLVVQLL